MQDDKKKRSCGYFTAGPVGILLTIWPSRWCTWVRRSMRGCRWKDGAIKSFRSLVGNLLCITRCTRPDIVFSARKPFDTPIKHGSETENWQRKLRNTSLGPRTCNLECVSVPRIVWWLRWNLITMQTLPQIRAAEIHWPEQWWYETVYPWAEAQKSKEVFRFRRWRLSLY